MPDSFPFDDEGPDPYQGQDLDGLLSGENCYVPETLRPVIPTLDALRAAPMRAELRGEAEARAYFRTIMRGGESEPARPEAGAVGARTLILPTVRPHGEPQAPRRPHRHRRPPRRGHWQAKALAGVAAAAVVTVGATALASTFSSSGGHPAVAGGSHRATSATTAASAPGSNALNGNGTPTSVKPTVSPVPKTSKQSGSGPSPSELCRELSGFFAHQGQHASPAAEHEIYQRLMSLAGGPRDVGYYCARLLQPWAMPEDPGKFPAMLRNPFAEGLQSPQGTQSSQGPQGAGPSPGSSGSGNGGNSGNGSNANGSGASKQ